MRYMFDVKPLVHPTENLVSEEMCKAQMPSVGFGHNTAPTGQEMGAACPDARSLASLREMCAGGAPTV